MNRCSGSPWIIYWLILIFLPIILSRTKIDCRKKQPQALLQFVSVPPLRSFRLLQKNLYLLKLF